MHAKLNDKVIINYTCQLTNGLIITDTRKDKPIQIIIGDGAIFPAIENALIGLHIGKTVVVNIPKAYGEYKQELIIHLPKNIFPINADLQIGQFWQIPYQKKVHNGKIKRIFKNFVDFDTNHFLAGEDLIFTAMLLNIVA